MEIVWATANVPDPTLSGGAIHEYELLSWAAVRHDVTLVSAGLEPRGRLPDALADLPLRAVVGCARPDLPQPSRPVLLWQSLAHGLPHDFRAAAARVSALAEEVRRHQADLVQVVWAEAAPVAIECARRGPTAFFAADSFTLHARRELAAATTVRQKLYRWLQLRQMERWEHTYRGAGAVAVASPLDAEHLRATGVDTSVVPSALGDEWFAPSDRPRDQHRVSFIASLDYRPNQDAADWLLDEIWPRVRAATPGAVLHIVGRNPTPSLRDRVAAAGGVLQADVPDIRPAYWATTVALIPVRLGSGMRNKVLHAVACGAPVVATSMALEGIPLEPGDQVRVADDAAGLAQAVSALLADPDAAVAMAARARPVADAVRASEVGSRLEDLWQRARVGWKS